MGIITRCVVALSAVAVATAFQTAPITSFNGLAAGNKCPLNVARHSSGIVMSGKIRELRDRISSISNSQKITSAMRLVAAAKVRRAQEAVTRTRPFSEVLEKVLGGLLQRLKMENLDLPLLEERPVNKVTLVVVTGDRGLCGSYNAMIIKKTEQRFAQLKEAGIPVELVTVGKKGNTYFARRDFDIPANFDCPQTPSAEFATGVADKLLAKYLSGETDRIEIIYSKFVSLISSTPTIRTMLPLNPTGLESEGDEIFQLTTKDGEMAVEKTTVPAAAPKQFAADMIFEQEPVDLLNAILPLYFNGQVLRTIQEGVASELAARMTAMQSASDNAKSLKKTLTLDMNRARQAEVTQAILEVVAGAGD